MPAGDNPKTVRVKRLQHAGFKPFCLAALWTHSEIRHLNLISRFFVVLVFVCLFVCLLTFLWVHMNLFWQLSRNGNLYGSGMSHATTASPKPSFRAHWRVGDAVISKGNAGTTSKSSHISPCQNCSQGPPVVMTGRGSRLNRPSFPRRRPNRSREPN